MFTLKAQLQATLFWCSLLKFFFNFILKDNLIDRFHNTVPMVHMRIIADMSIAYDWQGIRYDKKKNWRCEFVGENVNERCENIDSPRLLSRNYDHIKLLSYFCIRPPVYVYASETENIL